MKTTSLVTGGLIAALGLTLAPGAAGATAPPADGPEFCAPWAAATALFSSEEEVDPAAAEQVLTDVGATTPDEIAGPVGTVVEAATLAASGDFSGFDDPAFFGALSEVDGWIFDNCVFDQRIEVQAVDWAFGDIPLEITAGSTAFRLTNLGDEVHEMVIVRKAEGTTETFQELMPLLAAQDPAAMEKVVMVGSGFSPGPDAPGVIITDLVPGEYAAICFVPIGSLQEMAAEEGATAGSAPADTATDGTAPADTSGGSAPAEEGAYDPHAAHGMLQLFTVVEAG